MKMVERKKKSCDKADDIYLSERMVMCLEGGGGGRRLFRDGVDVDSGVNLIQFIPFQIIHRKCLQRDRRSNVEAL